MTTTSHTCSTASELPNKLFWIRKWITNMLASRVLTHLSLMSLNLLTVKTVKSSRMDKLLEPNHCPVLVHSDLDLNSSMNSFPPRALKYMFPTPPGLFTEPFQRELDMVTSNTDISTLRLRVLISLECSKISIRHQRSKSFSSTFALTTQPVLIPMLTNGNRSLKLSRERTTSSALTQLIKALPQEIWLKTLMLFNSSPRTTIESCYANHSPRTSVFMVRELEPFQSSLNQRRKLKLSCQESSNWLDPSIPTLPFTVLV